MVRDESLKWINEPIPDERLLKKTEVYKKVLRVHDVMLQRVDEFNHGISGIKDENIKFIGTALGEIIKMNEEMASKLVSSVNSERKEFEKLLTKALTEIRLDLKSHMALVDERMKTHRIDVENQVREAVKDRLSDLTDVASEAQERFRTMDKKLNDEINRVQTNFMVKLSQAVTELKDAKSKFQRIAKLVQD